MQLRVIGGFLLLTSFFALLFDVLYFWTQVVRRVELVMDTYATSIEYINPLCLAVPVVLLGLLLLAGAFSALAGRRWGLSMLACACAMASALAAFYWTAIVGTSALIFIAQSRSEFLDRQTNPLPPARKEPGESRT